MAGVAKLKTHIIQYSKTREVYAAYKKSRHKKEFLAEHGAEIAQHEAAKKAFDALDGKAIPKVAQLSAEYTALLEEKREQYEQYKALRQAIIVRVLLPQIGHNIHSVLFKTFVLRPIWIFACSKVLHI